MVRAWDLDNGGMFFSETIYDTEIWVFDGGEIQFLQLQTIDREVGGEHIQTEEYVPPKQILMQYTGLDDKNGVPIYEGDVCREIYHDVADSVGEIKISPTQGVLIGNSPVRPRALEVIGDIHQNPELIK